MNHEHLYVIRSARSGWLDYRLPDNPTVYSLVPKAVLLELANLVEIADAKSEVPYAFWLGADA